MGLPLRVAAAQRPAGEVQADERSIADKRSAPAEKVAPCAVPISRMYLGFNFSAASRNRTTSDLTCSGFRKPLAKCSARSKISPRNNVCDRPCAALKTEEQLHRRDTFSARVFTFA